MQALWKTVQTLRPWQIVLLLFVLLGAGGSAYTVYAKTNGPSLEGLTENQEIIIEEYGDLVNQVSTNGNLVFPEKEALAFGTEGEVVELLVQEGQRVSKRDLLARLDPVTVASLEKAVAQARLDLQGAEEALEDVREGYSPLELAEAEERVADAEFQLQQAADALDDAREPFTQEDIKTQQETVAAARLGLQDAEDALADAEVASAQLALKESIQRLEDSSLRFPLTGWSLW